MEEYEALAVELSKIPWFQTLKPEQMHKLSTIAHMKRIRSGEIIYKEGDKEDDVYIVIEGRVALDIYVPHHGRLTLYTVEPIDIFGWSSVTPISHQRTTGAIAIMDSLVVGFDLAKLRNMCEEDHDLGYLVMRRLLNVISGRLLVSRLQLIDMFTLPEGQYVK